MKNQKSPYLASIVMILILAIITAVRANTREVEKKILDEILGSKAWLKLYNLKMDPITKTSPF